MVKTLEKIKDENLHKLMLKKIRLQVRTGQSVLHLSDRHEQITDMLGTHNLLRKVSSLDEVEETKKAFTYVVADLDNAALDDFDAFLERVAPLIIRPGLLILVATNLCTFKNSWQLFFGAKPDEFSRPCRAVPPGYLRNKLLEKGYFVKNRFWQYDNKLLIMADIPNKY